MVCLLSVQQRYRSAESLINATCQINGIQSFLRGRRSSPRVSTHLSFKKTNCCQVLERSDLEEITFRLAFVHLPARHQPYQVSGRGIPESRARYSLRYLLLLVLWFFPNKVEKCISLSPLKKKLTLIPRVLNILVLF